MFFIARRFPSPISGSSRLSSPSRARGGKSSGCRQGRVPQAFGLCNSLLDIYSFVRFYLYSSSVRAHLICTRSPAARAPFTSDRSFKRHETRNPLPSSPRWKRKKINGRIRMNFINWIARRAPRFDAARTTLCRCGVTCCNRLLRAPLPPLRPRCQMEKETYQLPIAFYSLSPIRWLWVEMNFYVGLFIMQYALQYRTHMWSFNASTF